MVVYSRLASYLEGIPTALCTQFSWDGIGIHHDPDHDEA